MVKVHIILAGNTLNSHQAFWEQLAKRIHAESVSLEECDVTLTFCPIVSRVGTDIEAAVKQIPASRPGALVALHSTFNPEYIVPDFDRFVPRSDIITASCLFHDGKLLNCHCNEEAYKNVYDYLKRFHREIPVQIPHSDPSHPTHCDCLDAVQHPKYLIVGVSALVIVFLVVGASVLLTSLLNY